MALSDSGVPSYTGVSIDARNFFVVGYCARLWTRTLRSRLLRIYLYISSVVPGAETMLSMPITIANNYVGRDVGPACRCDLSVVSNNDFRSLPIPIYEFRCCGILLHSSFGLDTFARIMYCFATSGDFRLTSASTRIFARCRACVNCTCQPSRQPSNFHPSKV